jgi:class 3 adenylate cyclase
MVSLPGGPARAAAIRTFLIADVRGYTRFTSQHGDEAASRLATRFAEVAAEGVEAWGGELVELRGDEALEVIDSPRPSSRVCAGGTSRWRPRPTGRRAARPSRRLHSRSGRRASSGRPRAR